MLLLNKPFRGASRDQPFYDVLQAEEALTRRWATNGPIINAPERRYWTQAVESLSGGRNTIMYDDLYNPNVMVRIPKGTCESVVPGSGEAVHPAFIVNGAEMDCVWIAKYSCIFVGSESSLRAISLRMRDPGNTINLDNAMLACKRCGTGWHLQTNAEWAYNALWSKINNCMPRGNNSYGTDHGVQSERGIVSYRYFSDPSWYNGRVYTGSGPRTWAHDGTIYGIWDMNGNVLEWVSGLRIYEGEIQVLENNNAADNTKDQSASSTEWKAIMQDGSLVAPGSAGTLKYDCETTTPSGIRLNTTVEIRTTSYTSKVFQSLVAAPGVTIPGRVKLLALAPVDGNHGGDYLYMDNRVGAERCAGRGGNWGGSSSAGVFYLYLINDRSYAGSTRGFRSAFVRL